MHWKGSNCIGRGPIYGYISTKGQGYVFMGIFIIFLIRGGGNHGIYIIKLEINMNFEEKVLSIANLGLKKGEKDL